MHCLVVGVNGVGKTTLLQEVSRRTGITVLHATTELMKFMGLPLDYERLRAMDQDKTLEQWELAVQNLAREYQDKPYLLDGHIMNLTEGTFISRAGDWVGLQDALVMLKARPDTILKRVLIDDSRNRDLFPDGLTQSEKLALLQEYQYEVEKLFHRLAEKYQLRHATIDIDHLPEAAANLEAFIQNA